MQRIKKYSDELDELLHPFWLGIIMLFTVIIVVGMLCCLRKKCGSNLCYLFNRLRGRNDLNDEQHLKAMRPVPITNPYNWGLPYAPPSGSSPKFYKLIRNLQTISMNKELSMQPTDINDNDIAPITDESNCATTSLFQSNENRNSEKARKFYAIMRHTSQSVNSSSVESSNTELGLLPRNRFVESNRPNKLKFLRTSRFFQSITDI